MARLNSPDGHDQTIAALSLAVFGGKEIIPISKGASLPDVLNYEESNFKGANFSSA